MRLCGFFVIEGSTTPLKAKLMTSAAQIENVQLEKEA